MVVVGVFPPWSPSPVSLPLAPSHLPSRNASSLVARQLRRLNIPWHQ